MANKVIVIFRSFLLVSCMTGMTSKGVAVESTNSNAVKNDPWVGYSLDFRLGYFDKLRNPFAKGGSDNNLGQDEKGRERTLGLTKAKGNIWWWLPGESRLSVVVRPDAMSEGEVRREFDSRAGEVYRERPIIRLLDAYTLEKHFNDQLIIGVGVYEDLISHKGAYDPVIEFGLEVQLPQRSSAAKFEWRLMDKLVAQQPPKAASGWIFTAMAFQGDQDRAELRAENDETFDKTPTGKDPHYGGSVGIVRVDGLFNRFSLDIGMADNRYRTVDDDGDIVATGKRNEVFGQVANELLFAALPTPTKLVLAYRLSKEKWKGEGFDISPRTHQSLSLTSSVQVRTEKWILLGAHYGRSKFSNSTNADGYQIDLGYKFVAARNIWVTFAGAEEHRQLETGGDALGAFQKDSGKTEKVLRRYALEIAYQFDER